MLVKFDKLDFAQASPHCAPRVYVGQVTARHEVTCDMGYHGYGLPRPHRSQMRQLIRSKGGTWDGIDAEGVARMRLQNRFKTGLDIARYTAGIMREDMAAYDADPANYTQSLGCWHGFIAQQKLISIKKHFGTTKRRYLYLSGWMVAALRSEFGPLPDQSMHEKTSVPALIEELYTFLQAGRRARTGRPVPRPRRGPRGRRQGQGTDADRRDRQLRDPRRADHRRHRRRLRQCRGDLPAGQEDDRGRRLRAADREPGLRREAVRPPGRQGHRAARGLPREDPRRAATPSSSWASTTASSSPAPTRWAPA